MSSFGSPARCVAALEARGLSPETVGELTLAQLRRALDARGLKTQGLVEKGDFARALKKALEEERDEDEDAARKGQEHVEL